MPKIDPAMQKQIDATIDAVLKKNKDIKAVADIDRTIDNYMKKNKESIANARLIQQLERRLQDMDSKVKLLEVQVAANKKQADANMKKFLDMEMNKILKQWEKGKK